MRVDWSWPYGDVGVGVGGGDTGEQAQAFFGVAARLGVVGDQGLHVAARDEQPFVVELQRPDLRVVEQAGAGRTSTASEVIDGVDLSGKRAIVTGAGSGIGTETARALASAGAEVVLAVRRPQAWKTPCALA